MTLEQALARIAELEAEIKELKTAEYFWTVGAEEYTAETYQELLQHDVYGVAFPIIGAKRVFDKWVIRIPLSIDADERDLETEWREFDTEEEAEEAYTKARLNLENGRVSQ